MCMYGCYIAFKEVFTGLKDNSKSPFDSKFDFKQAKDVQTRLDEVKGIDEITNEITDLINMLKNPK